MTQCTVLHCTLQFQHFSENSFVQPLTVFIGLHIIILFNFIPWQDRTGGKWAEGQVENRQKMSGIQTESVNMWVETWQMGAMLEFQQGWGIILGRIQAENRWKQANSVYVRVEKRWVGYHQQRIGETLPKIAFFSYQVSFLTLSKDRNKMQCCLSSLIFVQIILSTQLKREKRKKIIIVQ